MYVKLNEKLILAKNAVQTTKTTPEKLHQQKHEKHTKDDAVAMPKQNETLENVLQSPSLLESRRRSIGKWFKKILVNTCNIAITANRLLTESISNRTSSICLPHRFIVSISTAYKNFLSCDKIASIETLIHDMLLIGIMRHKMLVSDEEDSNILSPVNKFSFSSKNILIVNIITQITHIDFSKQKYRISVILKSSISSFYSKKLYLDVTSLKSYVSF